MEMRSLGKNQQQQQNQLIYKATSQSTHEVSAYESQELFAYDKCLLMRCVLREVSAYERSLLITDASLRQVCTFERCLLVMRGA